MAEDLNMLIYEQSEAPSPSANLMLDLWRATASVKWEATALTGLLVSQPFLVVYSQESVEPLVWW